MVDMHMKIGREYTIVISIFLTKATCFNNASGCTDQSGMVNAHVDVSILTNRNSHAILKRLRNPCARRSQNT